MAINIADVRNYATRIGQDLPSFVEDEFIMKFLHDVQTAPEREVYFLGNKYKNARSFYAAMKKGVTT